jgi:HlyD family secretion protein
LRRSLIRVLIVVAFLALAGWALYARFAPRPVAVVVMAVERGWVEATVANTRAGTVMACRRAKLSPQLSGKVAKLPVRKGDRVARGSLLLELWNDDLRSRLTLARSEARAATATAAERCLAAELAGREADRAARLFRDHVVDAQALDRATAERDTTHAGCDAARAMAEESASRVEVARSEMERSILLAPFDGIVAELNAEMGEMVTPSPPGIPTPPAVDFIEEGCMYVTAPIDEIDGRSVRTGQPARITLDAYPGERFEGTVRRVAPYVLDREKQARTLEVEVAIDDPASIPGLVPGFSADVEILLERREGVLRVPAEALSGTDRVMLLEGDHLGERKIATGIANWQYVEVTSGLGEGDLIVLSLDRAGVQAGARAVAGQPPSP